MDGLLTKSEVRIAGYQWQGLFLRVDGPRRSRGPQTRTRPISSHLDRTSLANKGSIIWKKECDFLAGHSGQEDSTITARVRFGSFCPPAYVASHMINVQYS